MSILTWIEDKKRLKVLNAPKYVNSAADSSKGLWTRCDKCGVILYIKHLKENQRVCFGCSYHLQMMSQERIENLLDKVPATSYSSDFEPLALQAQTLNPYSTSFVQNERNNAPLAQRVKKQGIQSKQEHSTCKAKLCNLYGDRRQGNARNFNAPSEGLYAEEGGNSLGSQPSRQPNDLRYATPQKSTTSLREKMVSTWRPLDETVSPCDPLKFLDQKNYTDRLQDAQERTGLQDAIQTGTGMIDGIPIALAVMDFSFMGGSMGSVVGEKITRLIEYATQEGLTLIIVSASGGARMQEGVFSLMQMAKISSALQIYQSCAKLLYISILTSPTTGGVTASFAMLGDIIFAEPKALIAFAGRRVIEQTLCEDLPDDFQTSEYMLHHGLVDLIVPRRFLRQALSESIRLYQNAPFKKIGRIPFGVQNPITFLTEEKVRRQWGRLTKKGTKSVELEQSIFNELSEFSSKSIAPKPLNLSEESTFCFSKTLANSKNIADNVSSPSIETSPKQVRYAPFGMIDPSWTYVQRKASNTLAYKSSICKQSEALHGHHVQIEDLSEQNEKRFVNKGWMRVQEGKETTLPYREILTSFRVMLNLFSPIALSFVPQVDSANEDRFSRADGTQRRVQSYDITKNISVVRPEKSLILLPWLKEPNSVLKLFYYQKLARDFNSGKVYIRSLKYQLWCLLVQSNNKNGNIPIKEVVKNYKSTRTLAYKSSNGYAMMHGRHLRFVRKFVVRTTAKPGSHFQKLRLTETKSNHRLKKLLFKLNKNSSNALFHTNLRFVTEEFQKSETHVCQPNIRLLSIKKKTCKQNHTLNRSAIGLQIFESKCEAGTLGIGVADAGAHKNLRFTSQKRSNFIAYKSSLMRGSNKAFSLRPTKLCTYKPKPITTNDNRANRGLSTLPYTENNRKDLTNLNPKALQENEINLLNQAIELAATESVEWRAFYMDQQFSERVLQVSCKTICRSEKMVNT